MTLRYAIMSRTSIVHKPCAADNPIRDTGLDKIPFQSGLTAFIPVQDSKIGRFPPRRHLVGVAI